MQPYSDYEIAQQRINTREKKKASFYLWLLLTGIIFFAGTAAGGSGARIFWPIGVLVGMLPLTKGIQLYYESPHRKPLNELTQLEMGWLFGDDWQAITSAREYVLAQDRIRKRYIDRWVFVFHTVAFLVINLSIFAIFTGYKQTGEPGGEWWLIVPFVWFFFYIRHAISVFPTKRRLEKRERRFGQTLQHELYAMHPEELKQKEKLKRGKYYEVGDDGELVEVEDEVFGLKDKPKREASDG